MNHRAALAAGAAALLAAGCDPHHELDGPAGLSFACADGRTARIYYEGGGDPARARARLLFEGRTFEMRAVPTLSGLRYASDAALTPGHMLIWSAEGDEAILTEAPADPAASGEREVARCARVRENGDYMPDGGDHH